MAKQEIFVIEVDGKPMTGDVDEFDASVIADEEDGKVVRYVPASQLDALQQRIDRLRSALAGALDADDLAVSVNSWAESTARAANG